MVIAKENKELFWLATFLKEESLIYNDNQNIFHQEKDLVFQSRTKHILMRFHLIAELISDGTLSLQKLLGTKNLVDMLTKFGLMNKLKLFMDLVSY